VDVEEGGGGIHALGNQVFIVDNHGNLFLYTRGDGQKSVQKLPTRVDSNFDAFKSYLYSRVTDEFRRWEAEVWFRFNDILYREESGRSELLLSHQYWHEEKECASLRVSRLDLGDWDPQTPVKLTRSWETLYDSQPCLPFKERGNVLAGMQAGGRMELASDGHLLLTVGDFQFDGYLDEIAYSQDLNSDYGKIWEFDLATGERELISIGHRNPQGIAVDSSNHIWSTEHGAKGGDELNLILEGQNYGWPRVSFGAQYGMTIWPGSNRQGRHNGFTRPTYVWVPSIGVSNLIEIRNFLPEWDGDLLVASMANMTLYRIRYIEGRVLVTGAVKTGFRIRDLDQLEDGTIVLWSDDAAVVELHPETTIVADVKTALEGRPRVLREKVSAALDACIVCHSLKPGASSLAGPGLWGVVGRKIGAGDFRGYSSALKNHAGVWDDESLESFLEDPSTFAPGTTMVYPGISDPEVRQAMIEYLKALR